MVGASQALALALAALPCFAAAAEDAVILQVRETAGIRRFSYPVSTAVHVAPPAPGASWRLVAIDKADGARDDRPVDAQFTTSPEAGAESLLLAVDFEASLLPFEVRRYRLEALPPGAAPPGAAGPSRGLRLEDRGDAFVVSSGDALVYTLPSRSLGLLSSVRAQGKEFLRGAGGGLQLLLADGALRGPRGPVSARVVKAGPVVCALLYQWREELAPGAPVSCRVEVELPRSKSWIRVRASIDDPAGVVAGVEGAFDLSLPEAPVLVDFGASEYVYARLSPGQAAALRAGPEPSRPWEVLHGRAGTLEPFVTAREGAAPAEGWAHLMDARRCTALAVAGFSGATRDRIEVDATGRVRIARTFQPGQPPARGAERELTFWLHFVDVPPHVGAATSPQSMLAPLEARWSGP